jgi:SAM-dependent methyltransferase
VRLGAKTASYDRAVSSAPASGLAPDRFHSRRPTDLRTARPWHRLSYIVDALPAALRGLIRELGLGAGDRVLDYGCAEGPYHGDLPAGVEVVGADLPGNAYATVELSPDGRVPVEDESFDAVLSTQVLEHVADPDVYLSECARVLVPGGRLLLSTHGIMVWHPDPVDLWRWTGEGLRTAVERHGFEVVRFEGVMGLGGTGVQLVQDAILHRLPRRLQPALCLLTQGLIRAFARFESADDRRRNALVFALVATRT